MRSLATATSATHILFNWLVFVVILWSVPPKILGFENTFICLQGF